MIRPKNLSIHDCLCDEEGDIFAIKGREMLQNAEVDCGDDGGKREYNYSLLYCYCLGKSNY